MTDYCFDFVDFTECVDTFGDHINGSMLIDIIKDNHVDTDNKISSMISFISSHVKNNLEPFTKIIDIYAPNSITLVNKLFPNLSNDEKYVASSTILSCMCIMLSHDSYFGTINEAKLHTDNDFTTGSMQKTDISHTTIDDLD